MSPFDPRLFGPMSEEEYREHLRDLKRRWEELDVDQVQFPPRSHIGPGSFGFSMNCFFTFGCHWFCFSDRCFEAPPEDPGVGPGEEPGE